MSSDPNDSGSPESGGGSPGMPPPPAPPASFDQDSELEHAEPTTEPKAVAAIIVALVGIFLAPVLLGPVALLLASMANGNVRKSEGALTGYRQVPVFGRLDLIKTAFVLGMLDVVFGVVILAFVT